MSTPATTPTPPTSTRGPGLRPVFQIFGGEVGFSGPIATVKVFETNTLVKQAVGARRRSWLVVDGVDRWAAAFGGRQPRGLRRDQRLGRHRRPRLHPGPPTSSRAADRVRRSPPCAQERRGPALRKGRHPGHLRRRRFREGELAVRTTGTASRAPEAPTVRGAVRRRRPRTPRCRWWCPRTRRPTVLQSAGLHVHDVEMPVATVGVIRTGARVGGRLPAGSRLHPGNALGEFQ